MRWPYPRLVDALVRRGDVLHPPTARTRRWMATATGCVVKGSGVREGRLGLTGMLPTRWASKSQELHCRAASGSIEWPECYRSADAARK